jgi:4-amino-4-deoxy-L-arabinose transferase-like glycosyltransferase
LSFSTAPEPEPTRSGSVLILLAITLAIYVGSAGRPGLLDDADGCHALAAREILQRQDWSVLHINGIRYLEKPPLHYWLVALSYLSLGESAFATRLPIALAMFGLVLLLYEFGRRFFSERAGFYAGLVMGTSAGSFLFTRIMIPEALYALEFTATFYLFLRAWTSSLSPRTGYWGAASIIGLATLTRAGIGAFFPLGIIAIFAMTAGAWSRSSEARRRLAAIPIWSASVIALVVALPWHVIAALRTSGFLWFYFVNEQILRALGKRYPPDYTAVPLGIWWIAHAVWFFPWIVFAAYAWRERPSFTAREKTLDVSSQARLLVFSWVATIFLFFSIVSGSRMEYYSFGAWPAVALLIGLGLARAEARNDRWLPRLQSVLVVVGVLCASVLFGLLWVSREVTDVADITKLLTRHDTDFYRVSMATFFDLTPQAFAALRLPAALAATALVIGPVIAWWLRVRARPWGSTVTVALTMVVFCYAANLAFQTFEPRMSSKMLASDALKFFMPEDRLIVYGEFEQACSFSFYLDRQAWIYNGRYNGLEFGSYFADAPRIFLDDEQFAAQWMGHERTFLFVPAEQREAALARVSRMPNFLVAESGSKAIYSNQPISLNRHAEARPEPH